METLTKREIREILHHMSEYRDTANEMRQRPEQKYRKEWEQEHEDMDRLCRKLEDILQSAAKQIKLSNS